MNSTINARPDVKFRYENTEKDFGLTGWSDYLDHNNGVYVQRADRPKANWIERFDSKVPKDFYSRMFDLLTSSSKTKANNYLASL